MTTGTRSLLFVLACAAVAQAGVVKKVLDVAPAGDNLLKPEAWRAWQAGFSRDGQAFACDNGRDAKGQRGVSQAVELNQTSPTAIIAEAWSKAENVGGMRDSDYSLYLDLTYTDGTPLWGQIASFTAGTHDWERRRVVVLPAKPVKSVSFYMLLRNHAGKVWFRDARLQVLGADAGAAVFDGLPVTSAGRAAEGFLVRDVAAASDFDDFGPDGRAETLGLQLASRVTQRGGVSFVQADLTDRTGKDRAATLYYTLPAEGDGWRWLVNPRTVVQAAAPGEYLEATRFNVGANGMLSRYPFAAIAQGSRGRMIGIDPAWPAFYRCCYSAGSHELFLAFDLGLTAEKPLARVRFVVADFDGALGFRGALQRYYELFPDCFRCRTPQQGIWMPFAPISKVEGWQDFGFKFKEGTDETAWDDAHGIVTFRYTEPMTSWMPMPAKMPRTLDAALAEARRLADEGRPEARVLFTSGFHDESGHYVARLLDTPWCKGAVWSINSSPGVQGAVTDWSQKWGPAVRERWYGPGSKGNLDGEYVDSSEGYVTDELDFRRDHLAAAVLPLTFSPESHRPAVFRGLIAGEYVRQMAIDVHAQGKLMMANATPGRLCWLAPWLDVMGTETDWNPPDGRGGSPSQAKSHVWRPMSDAEMLYRRAVCGPKPYCLLMNTDFPSWSAELTERYMKRCLAYGMFPGFFSADASTGHYFSQPALYNRDRPLFKKHVPLCKRVAEAGWQPITKAHSSDPHVYVERFGAKLLTVFRDAVESHGTEDPAEREPRPVIITLDGLQAKSARELLSGRHMTVKDGAVSLELAVEDVAVLELE